MRKLSYLFLAIFLLAGCGTTTISNVEQSDNIFVSSVPSENSHYPNYVTIKYRDDSVDIGHSRFEYLNTSKSSFVRGAWYDKENEYMVIKLKETNYHYCSLSRHVWSAFRKADSFGSYYEDKIKGNYDCRVNFVPKYSEESSITSEFEAEAMNTNNEPIRFRNPVLDSDWKLRIEEDSPYFPEDSKSVFVEKIQSSNKLTVSWIVALDGDYVLRTKDIILIGIEPKQSCRKQIMEKIAEEIANEDNYIVLTSDPNIQDASYRYAWLRSKDNGILYKNISDELIKSGYTERASNYNYSETEYFKKLEDLARLEERGLWQNGFVCD